MGTNPSTSTTSTSNKDGMKNLTGGSGLESVKILELGMAEDVVNEAEVHFEEEPDLLTSDEEIEYNSDDDSESDTECDEDEDEDDLLERLRVLEDAKKLKSLAVAFLHPEKSVEVESSAAARSYFDRASAVDVEDQEDAEEQAQLFTEVKKLRLLAVDYSHPEVSVVASDATATARCYFDRLSAEPQESKEAVERELVVDDAALLKKAAFDYLHPEAPVIADYTSSGRNYFTSTQFLESESEGSPEERALVMADAMALKKLATDYARPELPVGVTDPAVVGRNFFSRVSASSHDTGEDSIERDCILADAKGAKELAEHYAHPEVGVCAVDPAAYGRNFFERFSTSQKEDGTDEVSTIISDASVLSQLAVNYLHPEKGITSSDRFSCGRNYFDRYSGPEVTSKEESEDLSLSLSDSRELKKLAVQHAHPEISIASQVDANSFGRNYFSRGSAAEMETEDALEREKVLAEVAVLKKLATDYVHPESNVVSADPSAFARNYFNRGSVNEVGDDDYKESVLADAVKLKKFATDHAHPEIPVTPNESCVGRNFFDRHSSPEMCSKEDEQQLSEILSDAKALKKLAVVYGHPENGVSLDPTTSGRNFFERASAPEVEEELDSLERAKVLSEAASFKQLAVDYAHPEKSLLSSDPNTFGRNYFYRATAQGCGAISSADTAFKKEIKRAESVVSSLPISAVKHVSVARVESSGDGMTRSASAVVLFGLDQEQQQGEAF